MKERQGGRDSFEVIKEFLTRVGNRKPDRDEIHEISEAVREGKTAIGNPPSAVRVAYGRRGSRRRIPQLMRAARRGVGKWVNGAVQTCRERGEALRP